MHPHPSRKATVRIIAASSALLGPAVALAHPGHGADAAFLSGALHPLTGLDHLTALLALGAWSTRFDGHQRWQLPAIVLAAMAGGALFAAATPIINDLDALLASSLLLLGLLSAMLQKLPRATLVPLAATFAVLHGLAHGASLSVAGPQALWLCGMLAASAALMAAGAAVAVRVTRAAAASQQQAHARRLGGTVAAIGIALLLAG